MNVDQLERSPQHHRKTTVTPAAPHQPIIAVGDAVRTSIIVPIVMLAVLLLLPFWLTPPRTSQTIDIGTEIGLNEYGESRQGFYLFDVNGPERDDTGQTYRWTKPFSTLRLLDIFALGSPLMLDLGACSCRPAKTPVAQTTLKINTFHPLELPLGSQPRTYRLLVPQRTSDYGHDLYLELRSTTFRLPGDDRDLGTRLDNVRVSFVHPWGLLGTSPLAAWALYAAAIVGAWLLSTLVSDLSFKTQNAKRKTRYLSSLLSPMLVAAFLLVVPYVYRPHIFTLPMVAVMSLLAIYGALVVARTTIHRFVLAGAGLWLVWSSQVLGHWMLDDAYISFHYAANMLAGHGLVFNPGERVEGYTNFLWTLLSAVPLAWGDPTMPMSLLTLALGIGTMLLTYRWGMPVGRRQEAGDSQENREARTENRKTQHSTLVATHHSSFITHHYLFAPLMLAVSSPFLLYTARGSGMETALFTFLLAAGSFAAQRARTARGACGAGALLALATMTRPDGVLGVTAAGLYLLVRGDGQWAMVDRQASNTYRPSPIAYRLLSFPLSFAFLLIFMPYYLWRYAYYGYPLPNTFYAKVGTGWAQVQRGLDYANAFAATIGWRFVILLLLGGLAAAIWQMWHRDEGLRTRKNFSYSSLITHYSSLITPFLLITFYTAYTIAVGGDHFPGFRFFVPLLPPLALLIQSALLALAHIRLGRWSSFPGLRFMPALSAAALALVYLVFTAMQLPATNIGVAWSDIRGENNVVEKNRELGLWLRDNTPPTTVVATGIAGALPFYSGLRVIDTLGLNDLHIAHLDVRGMGTGEAGAEKTDVPYVLEQRPDYIPYSTSGTFQGYPRFKQEYAPIEVRGPEGRAIKLYKRIVQ